MAVIYEDALTYLQDLINQPDVLAGSDRYLHLAQKIDWLQDMSIDFKRWGRNIGTSAESWGYVPVSGFTDPERITDIYEAWLKKFYSDIGVDLPEWLPETVTPDFVAPEIIDVVGETNDLIAEFQEKAAAWLYGGGIHYFTQIGTHDATKLKGEYAEYYDWWAEKFGYYGHTSLNPFAEGYKDLYESTIGDTGQTIQDTIIQPASDTVQDTVNTITVNVTNAYDDTIGAAGQNLWDFTGGIGEWLKNYGPIILLGGAALIGLWLYKK